MHFGPKEFPQACIVKTGGYHSLSVMKPVEWLASLSEFGLITFGKPRRAAQLNHYYPHWREQRTKPSVRWLKWQRASRNLTWKIPVISWREVKLFWLSSFYRNGRHSTSDTVIGSSYNSSMVQRHFGLHPWKLNMKWEVQGIHICKLDQY